jgi:glutamate N-acetyltransferase / amino-acid N-acetyltransferase
MLAYILTDLDVPRDKLDRYLRESVDKSFNGITVDGDQSTSDTVLVLSSKKVPMTPEDELAFAKGLRAVCVDLAESIVRNGEGTQHVVKVHVTGAPSEKIARDLGRFVLNSNLVKCAVAGCDPNVGRIVGAIGSYLGSIQNGASLTKGLTITLGGIEIFGGGAFSLNPATESLLSDYLLDRKLFSDDVAEHDRTFPPHAKTVDLSIMLNSDPNNTGECVLYGSDLTQEYVEVNADYRS